MTRVDTAAPAADGGAERHRQGGVTQIVPRPAGRLRRTRSDADFAVRHVTAYAVIPNTPTSASVGRVRRAAEQHRGGAA